MIVHSPASVSADCSDCLNAGEVRLAPETEAIFADCATMVSLHSFGIAFLLILAESPAVGYCGAVTVVILLFTTTIRTCTGP